MQKRFELRSCVFQRCSRIACVPKASIPSIFCFMIGTDVGSPGEREFQSQTTGRYSKSGGRYRAVGQEFELEFVPPRFSYRDRKRLRGS